MITVIAGNTVKLRCEFKTWAGVYGDPTDIVVNIYAPNKQRLIETIEVGAESKVAVGIYDVYYTVPSTIERLPVKSEMIYEFVGTLEGTQVIGQGKFVRMYSV